MGKAMAHLEVLEGFHCGESFPLPDDAGVGRHPESFLCLPEHHVSRHHARLRRRGSTFVIEDLRSSNGIIVQGKLISALLFSLPHALNLFVGHAEARVLAQLVWSFRLGVVFACLRISGRSIWPVAMLHGAMNAFVHVNRIGIEIQPSLLRAAALAFAPVPLCVYGAMLLRKKVTHQPENGANPPLT